MEPSFVCSVKAPIILILLPVLIGSVLCSFLAAGGGGSGSEKEMAMFLLFMSFLSCIYYYGMVIMVLSAIFSFICKGTTSQFIWIALVVVSVILLIYKQFTQRKVKVLLSQ